jgi:hypothetical protein
MRGTLPKRLGRRSSIVYGMGALRQNFAVHQLPPSSGVRYCDCAIAMPHNVPAFQCQKSVLRRFCSERQPRQAAAVAQALAL